MEKVLIEILMNASEYGDMKGNGRVIPSSLCERSGRSTFVLPLLDKLGFRTLSIVHERGRVLSVKAASASCRLISIENKLSESVRGKIADGNQLILRISSALIIKPLPFVVIDTSARSEYCSVLYINIIIIRIYNISI